MVESSRSLRILIGFVRALALLGVLVWLSAIGLFLHYDATRPTLKQPAEGRIYPWSNHGHIVYLTQQEQLRLYVLGGIAAGLFVIAAAMGYFAKLRQRRRQMDAQVYRSFR